MGWDRVRVETEAHAREIGFADYLFDPQNTKALILEAKREGYSFLLGDNEYPDRPVPFSLLAKESESAASALRQASTYATSFGSRYVAISNGHQWIFGMAFVPGESIEDRSVFVFESLDAIENRFRLFFKCFSPIGVLYNAVVAQLYQSHSYPAPPKLSADIPGYPFARTGEDMRTT